MSDLNEENGNNKEAKQTQPMWWQSDGIKVFLIPVITAIITAAASQWLSDYYWEKQFIRTNYKKQIEFKTTSLDKFVTNASKAIYLSEFAYRIKIELYLEECRISDSIYKATNIKLDTLPATEKYKVQLKISKNEPLMYKNYMSFLEFNHEYLASASIVCAQYENPIVEEINQLTNSIENDHTLIEELIRDAKMKNTTIFHADKDKIVNSATSRSMKILMDIVNKMFVEIKTTGSNQQ